MLLLGVNVPVPFVLQIPVEVAPLTLPFNVTVALFAQTATSAPACEPGASVIVTEIVCVTIAQPPVDDRVKLILPAVVSALLGIYVPFKVVLLGVNVPVPVDAHAPLPVDDEPFNVTFALFPQTVWLPPALTVGMFV